MTRGEWDWLPVDIIRSSGVHGGKLSNVKEVRDYNETHLYLDISSEFKGNRFYIRGYVGSNYTGAAAGASLVISKTKRDLQRVWML